MSANTTPSEPESDRGGAVDVGGRQIAYAEYGAPDGAPVLFFHGAPGSRLLASIFDSQAAADSIRVIAPERPGIGHSTPAPNYGLLDWSREMSVFVDALDLDSVGVIGFSGGGPHALAVGAGIDEQSLSKNRISGVGLLAGSGPPAAPQTNIDRSVRALGSAVRRFPRLAIGLFAVGEWIARHRNPTATVGLYSNRSVGTNNGAVAPETARIVHEDYCEAFRQGSIHVVRDSRRFLSDWAFDPATVDAPVVGWYGSEDSNVPPTHGEYLAQQLPDADISVESDLDHLGVLVECGPTAMRTVAP